LPSPSPTKITCKNPAKVTIARRAIAVCPALLASCPTTGTRK